MFKRYLFFGILEPEDTAFDDDPISYAHSNHAGIFTFDMGKLVVISKIECLLRNDGNEFPDWQFAMQSGHSGVSLIEVPIRSNSYNIHTEKVFKDGKKILEKRYETRRRLIIARRNTGETDMFVITIVPLPNAEGNYIRSMENFRYLGGGDFTGRVYCSTLEGEFVKAFGYTNGQMNGTLLVMKRSELEKHADESSKQCYSSINLEEGVRTRAGSYVFDEDGSNPDLCPHGYKEGECPTCMEEVDVVACPDCGTQNGCTCQRCFYCGQKEAVCTCSRCTRCGHKFAECTCYLYPDPKPNPDPNPGGSGGGGTNEGWFIVAGWKAASGSGHVVVIVPGETKKGNWNGVSTDLPNAMDTGANMKTESQLINRSFGKTKHKDVEFFKYK